MGSAYPTGAMVVPLGLNKPQRLPSRRADLGFCRVSPPVLRIGSSTCGTPSASTQLGCREVAQRGGAGCLA